MTTFQKRFPIFSGLINHTDFSGYAFVFIYHLNDNNAPFLEYWIKKVKTLAVISIPYSEVLKVKESISKLVPVITPNSVEDIPHEIETVSSKWKKKNIILIEVGGYSSYISHKLHNVVLAVEDTNQGHWNHLKSKNSRSYPVVSMAQSHVKQLENRVIGESITRMVEKLLPKYFPQKKFKKLTIGAISYGGIGSSVCLALRKRGILPLVYDTDPIKLSYAYADGYTIATKETLLKKSDIVIASTGQNSLAKKDAKYIKSGAIFFSGSSKKVEFKELLEMPSLENATSKNLFRRYKNGKKSFYIAYDGQPINFLDIVEPEEFDYILATMIACTTYGITNKLSNDIHTIPLTYQIPTFNLYLKKHMI